MANQSLQCLAIMALLFSAGCGSSEMLLQPEIDAIDLRFDIYTMDCQMTDDPGMTKEQKCALLQAGIDYLKAHANPECREMGGLAQDRFLSDTGPGFHAKPPFDGKDMSVDQAAMNGSTRVHPQFWINPFIHQPGATGALIAHEEKHHLGGDELVGAAMQETCRNSQA